MGIGWPRATTDENEVVSDKLNEICKKWYEKIFSKLYKIFLGNNVGKVILCTLLLPVTFYVLLYTLLFFTNIIWVTFNGVWLGFNFIGLEECVKMMIGTIFVLLWIILEIVLCIIINEHDIRRYK
jgi:hypothetical protein